MREIKKHVRFYIEKRSAWKDQSPLRPRNVVMLFNYNGNRLCTLTGMKVAQCDWDDKKQRVKLNVKRANEVNTYLNGIETKVNDIYFSSIAKGVIPDNNHILKEMSRDKQMEKPVFLIEWKKYLAVQKNKVKTTSHEALTHSFEHFERFAKGKRIDFDDMKPELVSEYATYLQKLGHVDNTIHKHIKRMRAFMTYAKKAELHNNDRYRDFNVSEKVGRIIFLEWEEVKMLLDYKPENEMEQNVLSNFLFGCLTALRYSDFHDLKRSQIFSVKFPDIPEAYQGISLRQLKTDKMNIVPLLPEALAIIERHKNEQNDYALPRLCNQTINRVIKDIAKKAGITRNVAVDSFKGGKRITEYRPKYLELSCHVSRKTFISVAAAKGIPIHIVADIAGHNVKTCMKFYTGVANKEKFTQVMKEMKFTETKNKQINDETEEQLVET